MMAGVDISIREYFALQINHFLSTEKFMDSLTEINDCLVVSWSCKK